ncbi:MAG: recombination regulator RecX [Lachnospiraceae bacterium]|nr:recombination regulator RecX [Lachnospiraceae bacterium]
MIVTQIKELNEKKVLVTVDGHLAFPLYKGELRRYGLREEDEIKSALWTELWDGVLVKRSRLRAMNLLQKKSYTKAELERKLRDNDYPQELVSQALDYVMKFHYVDDLRYAQDYIRYHSENRSRQRIRHDLLAKGISTEIFEQAWEDFRGDYEEWNEREQILRLLRKRHYDPELADEKEKAKTMAFLYRKGYGMDAISSAFSHLLSSERSPASTGEY